MYLYEILAAAALDAIFHVAQDVVVADLAVAAQVVVDRAGNAVAVVLLDGVVQNIGVPGNDSLNKSTFDADGVLADLVLHDLDAVDGPHLDARPFVLLNATVLQIAAALT